MQKIITEREVDLINNSCCEFIMIYCGLNKITSEEEQNAVFSKMYNDDLVNVFMKFKEMFYPNSEMDEEEYLEYSSSVIVESFGRDRLIQYIKNHNRKLN